MNMMNETTDVYALAGSEELSREFNDLAGMYSDFHKDVYGFRPRHMALCACDYGNAAELTEALYELKQQLARVEAASISVFARQEQEQSKSIDEFESYVRACLDAGATDRANAISWICESYDVQNDNSVYGWEHLEYLLNIPFGYIQKSLKEAA